MKKLIIALGGIILLGSISVYAAVETGSVDKILTAKIVKSFQKTYSNLEERGVNCDNYETVIERFQKRIKLTLKRNKVERTKNIKEYSKMQIINYVEGILACDQEEDVIIEEETKTCPVGCNCDGEVMSCKISPIECPQYTPPSPDFCKDGKIKTIIDSNGCVSKPICIKNKIACPVGCICDGEVVSCPIEKPIIAPTLNTTDISSTDRKKIPAKLTALHRTDNRTYLGLDLLSLNPNFLPGVNDYFINEVEGTRKAILNEKTKFYKCGEKSTALGYVEVENKEKKLTDGNVGGIYYFDIENSIVKTIYESCLP